MHKIDHQRTLALDIIKHLRSVGYTALFAGGCVRDFLLNRTPKDYDIATDATPEMVESLFPRTLAIGKAFGVIAVVNDHTVVEVATFRKDEAYTDGRRPELVHFCSAEEDASRRDFTINGMFYDPMDETLYDYVGGQKDLERKIIRAIGDPSSRFQEDHLRILRAVRFAYTLDFDIDPKTGQAIQYLSKLIQQISIERIEMELSRILTESRLPGDALKMLHTTGLLQHIIPEIIPMIGQEQPPQFHPEGDVFEHTVLMLNQMNAPDRPPITTSKRELGYAVLLHDVGKPRTASVGPDADGVPRIRFDGHAPVGAQMTEEILLRLRLPRKEIAHIVEAIRGHMRFIDVQKMKKSTLRKLIGAETFDLQLELHRLDCLGSHAKLDNYDFLTDVIQQLENEPILPEPLICGHDLLARGIQEGRLIGRILHAAYEAQIDQPISSKEELLDWVQTHFPQ